MSIDQVANAIGQAVNWFGEVLKSGWWAGVGSFATAVAVIITLGALVRGRGQRLREERTRQARQISGWVDGWQSSEPATDYGDAVPGSTSAVLLNASEVPVYGVIAWLVLRGAFGQETGEDVARHVDDQRRPTAVAVLPPGKYRVDLPEFSPGMHTEPAVEIGFTDSAGRHWIRRQDGALKEIKKAAAYHYGLGEPLDWGRAISVE